MDLPRKAQGILKLDKRVSLFMFVNRSFAYPFVSIQESACHRQCNNLFCIGIQLYKLASSLEPPPLIALSGLKNFLPHPMNSCE